jgi:hypothetical protein
VLHSDSGLRIYHHLHGLGSDLKEVPSDVKSSAISNQTGFKSFDSRSEPHQSREMSHVPCDRPSSMYLLVHLPGNGSDGTTDIAEAPQQRPRPCCVPKWMNATASSCNRWEWMPPLRWCLSASRWTIRCVCHSYHSIST